MPNLITLTGPSGSGKSEIMKIMVQQDPKYKILPKYTTRERRNDDDESVITVKELPEECDYVYGQYGKQYGFSSRMIADYLEKGKIPVVIVNDSECIKKLQAKFGTSMESYFIHRERPSRDKLIEIYRKTRGEPNSDVIEKRYQAALKIYGMYTDEIGLFDNIILNIGNGLEEVAGITKQILNLDSQKRTSNIEGNKIFVISGSPGSGKKILVQGANKLGCLQVPKHTNRERISKDGSEMICEGDTDYDLENCDLQYTNFGNRYGINTKRIWENLIMTNKHQILVCSDIEALQKLKAEFGNALISIYVHSDKESEKWLEENLEGNNNLDYVENRAADYASAFENYEKHFREYDKSLIYAGSQKELMKQFAGVLGISYKEPEQKKGVIKE